MSKQSNGRSAAMCALGLMSGTSMDGIDVAMIETDGEDRVVRGPAAFEPYPEHVRDLLRQATAQARSVTERTARPPAMAAAEAELTRRHGEAVARFLAAHPGARPEVVGFHGHTVLHRPHTQLTIQLGDGRALAAATGLPVVFDMRAADVAAGGEGAPLVPVYHRALVAHLPQRPIAILNVGGVANLTWIGRDGRLLAFDTGPGNALIDDWMKVRTNQTFDEHGLIAARGVHDEAWIAGRLQDPYFHRVPPKSLDRDAFLPGGLDGRTVEDGAATLTRFTAESVRVARMHLPEEPVMWIVTGGGRRNRTLMLALAEMVPAALVPAEAAGLDGDAMEAEAWCYLAVRAMKGLALTFPGTTGVARPITGGVVALPRA